jgi:hypothetical protein
MPEEPLGLLEYLRTHQRVPRAVIAAELPDAIQVLRYLRFELDRLELGVLRAGRRAGMTWSQLAPILGVSTRQAAEATLRRLEAAAGGGTKDEKPGRADRRPERIRDTASRQARQLYSGAMRAAARRVAQHRASLPDELAEELDYVVTHEVMHQVGTPVTEPWAILLDELVAGLEECPDLGSEVGNLVADLRTAPWRRRH